MNAPEVSEDADVSELSLGSASSYPAEQTEGDSETDIPVVGSEEGDSW